MIPVELRLTNFMSYKYMDEPLNFSSIHTAVLCGPNGHGKSSLLDAITWALWGRARGVDKRGSGADDLIHHKEAHMQVELTFELEDQRYRVIRSRGRKGRVGQSRLEFQVLDGDEQRPLTGETINATQEAINRALRMDYETFVNSAFIMQGRADTFMTKSPNERKEILSEILGLAIYDELEELAREKRKALQDTLKDIDGRFAFIDQELEHLPVYKLELKEATAEYKKIQAEIKKDEKALNKLREEKALYDMKTAQLSESRSRCAQVTSEIAAIDEQLVIIEQSADRARELVARKDEIESGYRELTMLRKKEEGLSKAGQEHTALEKETSVAKHAIEQARSALESHLRHLAERKELLEKELARKPQIVAARTMNTSKLSELTKKEQELNIMRESYGSLQQKKAAAESLAKADEAKLAELEKRLSLLSDDDTCPLCKRPVSDHDRHKIRQEFDREIAALRSAIENARSEASSTARELEQLASKGKGLADAVKDKDKLQVEDGVFAEQIKVLEKVAVEISAIQKQHNELTLKLAQSLYAQDDQVKLSRLTSQIQKLGYSAEEHLRVRERLKVLQKFDQLTANLENAQSAIKLSEATMKTLAKQKALKVKSLASDEKKVASLSEEIAALKDARDEIRFTESTLAEKKSVEASIINRRSAAQAKIDTCNELSKRKDELVSERKDVAKEVEIYNKLAFIFSKKGIQALVIENTIPEIEEEANVLLHKLTDGQMSLRFITQKDQKTGGVVETLDLIVTDGELGDRKYELFSGGEAFRINFAVRIALSKLLARRAGARLETLVVDEGFGTQDEEGKERLIEAISTIQYDFKKVIIITHLDDLKELFPARIEVTKRRGVGSVATVI